MIDQFENKNVLVTGGTGSFGGTILNRILLSSVSSVTVFSRDEKKQEDLRHKISDQRVRFVVGDVRDVESINAAMRGINYVFHAAALKQVPSCEFFPLEAVKTNIMGSANIMRACINHNVEKCIILSTDKSVYPINAMGMSKALMEKTMISIARSSPNTIFAATRYGNVMASRGSVIPLFVRQIREGKSLTITDPKMTRFLMSLNDSVNLVEYAFKNAKQGEIYVQKSPASTVETLAFAVSRIMDADPKIEVIGSRHGEKLYESLISREEMVRTSDCGDFFRINPDMRDLNYNIYEDDGELAANSMEDYTSHNTYRLDVAETIDLLNKKIGSLSQINA